MKTRKVLLVPLVLVSLSWVADGITLEKKTHEYINQKIAQRTINGFSLDSYLKSDLGFQKGAEEIVYAFSEVKKKQMEQNVWQWMGEGGIKEDEPESIPRYVTNLARNNNHFHNPLAETWDTAGLDIDVSRYKAQIPSPFRDLLPDHIQGQSSILWAHKKNQVVGGQWSWHDARKNLYTALTGKDFDGRVVVHTFEEMWQYYANTFRALGQLMHLVQDASVPAHVRGEFHWLKFHYETWLEAMRTSKSEEDRNKFDGFIASHAPLDRIIFEGPPDPLPTTSDANVKLTPIAKLIDTNKFTDREDTWTKTVGLAEFANANFFGEFLSLPGTPKCPFPDLKSPNVEERIDVIQNPRDPSKGTFRGYYYSKLDEPGRNGYRLATVGFLKDYITKYFPSYMGNLKPALDGGVYNDYASLLLPRAVSYSAGLLEYFFRGRIHIVYLIPSLSYSPGVDVKQCPYGGIARCSDTTTDIDTIHVAIQNVSKLNDVVEPVGAGTLSLTISYTDMTDGSTVYKTAGSNSVEWIPAPEELMYFNAVFHLEQTPIPTQRAKDLTYYLAFKGKLGQEEDAVIVRVVKGPVLQNVTPDQAAAGTALSIAGSGFIAPAGPSGTRVNFTWKPFISELNIGVINSTDSEITVKVPQDACHNGCLEKPSGGLRVLNILPEREWIYSNPLSFTALDDRGRIYDCYTEFIVGCCGYVYEPGPIVNEWCEW